MSDELGELHRAAKQLIDTDRLFGGQFIPTGRSELPEIESQSAAPAEMTKAEKKSFIRVIRVIRGKMQVTK